MIARKELKWYVGFTDSEASVPIKRVPAAVPGAVQLDWAKAEGWNDYAYADNYKNYSWMEDVYWSYSSRLELPELKDGEHLFFVCKGVDYRFKVKLNGKDIHAQEGMFTPFEIDLTGRVLTGDELVILVFPVPKRECAAAGRQQADQCCKPAVSYGWDWHPRLIPVGIWDETYLEVRPPCYIVDSEVSYDLNNDFSKSEVKLNAVMNRHGEGSLSWRFFGPDGNVVKHIECALSEYNSSGRHNYALSQNNLNEQNIILGFSLDNPLLWWPNGQGEAVLYRSVVELFDSCGNSVQRAESRVGFRRASLVMHPGAWNSPAECPKTRSNPPVTMEINGRQIFCKGSNWVNPEIFPGIITGDTYKPLIRMAKEANMNILRSWGGGIINKDSFFEQCDELGIMVWQEFPLACNNYAGTSEYLTVLDQESRSIIRRLRSHPCVVLWCGGNELFNSWSGMTDQSLALRLLNRNCYDMDPRTPFIMTSPLMGMSHGHYLFKSFEGREVFQIMPGASSTAYTEFGCPSPSSAEYLKKIIPREELFPPRPGTAWETHHAFNAWDGDTWLCPSVIEEYFGASGTLEEMVERGQLLQCEGYKCIFEEARRQKPKCSMALNWCYNEPWPTAANNSIINWPAIPKPGYYAVKASCRPVLASARINKLKWCEGETFNPELWILNDSPDKVESKVIKAYLQIKDAEFFLLQWHSPELAPNINLPGPTIRFVLPCYESPMMKLVLKVEGCSSLNSEYVLIYKYKEIKEEGRTPRKLNI